MQRSRYCAEAFDEQPVKVSKNRDPRPKELLNFLAAIRCGPFSHSANFSRVHLHPSRGYNEAKEEDRIGMKLSLRL